MLHLTLAGLSDDNTRLLLVSDKGEQFTLALDARLRAALRGEQARLGQLEIRMESALRPRDIQARIRAGESPESVAQAAQTTVDQIMPYASPVLAERAHVAQRAQRSTVRRPAGESGARTLGDAVATHLRSLDVDPTLVEWNAWRREDGRWTLTAGFLSGERTGTAQFTYDAPGSYVTTENDDARWLVGELVGRKGTAEGRARRRLSSVPADAELPLGDDAIEMVNEASDDATEDPPDSGTQGDAVAPGVEESTVDLTETAAQVRAAEVVDPGAESDDVTDETDGEQDDEPGEEAGGPGPAPSRRQVKKNRGRASVPSWDEIMFGGGSSD